MKLYFSPGACSLASHIVLNELGVPHTAVRVDLTTKRTQDGIDFNAINAKSYVPTLELDDGVILTEGPVIMQYLADQHGPSTLAPAVGTIDRYRLQEWLGFINSEIHKTYSILFSPDSSEADKGLARDKLAKKFDFAARSLGDKPYLCGEHFTLADAYLYTVLSWAPHVKVDLSSFPNLQAYQKRVAARPAVQTTQRAERHAA